MRIYGIASTEALDRTGESVSLEGMDISGISLFNDEHTDEGFFYVLGRILESKKIYSAKECTNEYELRCWNRVKRPFLYVYGELMDDHPNAAAASSLIKYSIKHPEFPVGLSVEGSTLERDGSRLTKTRVRNVSLTVRPANTDCIVFACDDLTKSFEDVQLPERYKNVQNRKQFRNIPSEEQRFLAKSEFIQELKELLQKDDQTIEGASIIRCFGCGQSKIFMKSRLPNRCVACGDSFSMTDIFKARCKKPVI